MANSVTDNERIYLISALGLTAAQGVTMAIDDLRALFYAGNKATINGSGSPEGVQTASPGTLYVDSTGAVGANVWQKRTGTGNTGWVVVIGDTGWRDVTLTSATVSGVFKLRRLNDLVYINSDTPVTNGAPTNGETLLTLGVGFKPNMATVRGLYGQGGGAAAKLLSISSAGAVQIFSTPTASLSVQFSIAFPTTDAWPAALPGVAG